MSFCDQYDDFSDGASSTYGLSCPMVPNLGIWSFIYHLDPARVFQSVYFHRGRTEINEDRATILSNYTRHSAHSAH